MDLTRNKERMSKLTFKKQMISHMSLESEHISQYKITINCEGHISHNQVFYQCSNVPKTGFMEFGEAETNFSWGEGGSIFDTVEDLFKHRNWGDLIDKNKN